MCGIVGGFPLSAQDNMIDSVKHRGPDRQGARVFPDGMFLGHTRLQIIDLTELGDQPMGNEDQSIWVVYNGEIYNFVELRRTLEEQGHQFRSRTDTEVIVHLYEELGEQSLRRLNGMFAFAIYDQPRARLLLARDRLGIKPLYYAYQNGVLVFGSEIKSILKSGVISPRINSQALYDYFSFLYVPHPMTIFEGISQVPPGHYLTFDLRTRALKLERYWSPEAKPATMPYEALRETLVCTLKDAVKRQMISDVPLGAFLSGGIDSTILVGLMAENSHRPVETFTVVFEGDGIKTVDERRNARQVSRHFGTNHHELRVDVSNIEDLFQHMNHFDQPFGNPTSYLSYLISKETRRYVTVALSGAGGDELFGGYPRYRILPYASYLAFPPKIFGDWAQRLLRLIPENYDQPLIRRAKLLARGLGQSLPEQYLRWTYYFSDAEKRRLLLDSESLPTTRIIEHYLSEAGPAGDADLYKRIQCLDLKTFLADNILEYTDRTSMAVALEVRVPYLDHRVLDLSLQIPFKYKIRKGVTKYILKDAFSALIPKPLRRAPKRGFCPPLAQWMDNHLDRYFDMFMPQEYTKRVGIFNWAAIQELRVEQKRRRRDNSMELFGIIMFDVWHRMYMN
ncbi:MAG: asparagine synthase (glutamine-hydrolyzing) [Acidobacteria bacterium]|nr:asparagine synthase (glutamine-hydrolyzing) [Acidobacteriota bacterium]MBI3658193.1 asparagine synthase (glutamine-hydrolyzing) [Acidobacteriota bacterium]